MSDNWQEIEQGLEADGEKLRGLAGEDHGPFVIYDDNVGGSMRDWRERAMKAEAALDTLRQEYGKSLRELSRLRVELFGGCPKRWRLCVNEWNLKAAPWDGAFGIEEDDDELSVPSLVCWFYRGWTREDVQRVIDLHNHGLDQAT